MEEISKKTEEDVEEVPGDTLRGWIIVVGISLLLVAYGFFAFFVIGDKQPAPWNFGAEKDVPGESVNSTYPYREGSKAPEPQHVNQKPKGAESSKLKGKN